MQEQLGCSKTEPRSSLGVENWCNESCTPLEEVLVEQCIRLGMPNKNHRKNLEGRSFKSVDGSENQFKNS